MAEWSRTVIDSRAHPHIGLCFDPGRGQVRFSDFRGGGGVDRPLEIAEGVREKGSIDRTINN